MPLSEVVRPTMGGMASRRPDDTRSQPLQAEPQDEPSGARGVLVTI